MHNTLKQITSNATARVFKVKQKKCFIYQEDALDNYNLTFFVTITCIYCFHESCLSLTDLV